MCPGIQLDISNAFQLILCEASCQSGLSCAFYRAEKLQVYNAIWTGMQSSLLAVLDRLALLQG